MNEENYEIIEIPVCEECGTKEIREGMGMCPRCNDRDPGIKYRQLIVYKFPFQFDEKGNLKING